MTLATVIYNLWSRIGLVFCVVVAAIVVAGTIGYNLSSFPPKSKKYVVGTATTRVLVDTPSSQVAAVNPTGLELVTPRANLLASLMVEGPIKAAIAERAGLEPDQVYGISKSTSSPTVAATTPPARGYALATTIVDDSDLTDPAGNELPIIQIDTQGPDAEGAANLANAAVAGLQQYVRSQATAEQLRPSKRLRLTSLGLAQGVQSVRGPRTLVVLATGVVIFLLGCALILTVPRFKREWRRATRARQRELKLGLDVFVWDVQDEQELRLVRPHNGHATLHRKRRPLSAGNGREAAGSGNGGEDISQ
jgi:hypothetical protein